MKWLRMWKAGLLAGVVVAAAHRASAAVVLEFQFVNSGQIVSPTDKVSVVGRVTNVGDDALVQGIGFGNYQAPTQIFNQYWDQFPSTLQVTPPGGPISLNTGEFIEWQLIEYEPWPLLPVSGDVGDPVLPDTYVLPASAFAPMKFSIIASVGGLVDIPVDLSQAADFTWTVSANGTPTQIPTPAAVTAGLALLLVSAARRRRDRAAPSLSAMTVDSQRRPAGAASA